MIPLPDLNVGAVVPMIVVGTGVVVLPIIEVLLARMIARRRTWLSRPMTRDLAGTMMAFSAAAFLGVALVFTLGAFLDPEDLGAHFNDTHPMIVMDSTALFLSSVVLGAAIMTVLLSIKYLSELRANRGEFYALVLASVLGMMLLCAATDLLMLFLALELMTIPVYALAGYQRESLRSNESALKYFIVGSFAVAIFLYGCSLLYGATGSISLVDIGQRLDPESPLAMLGAGLVIVGLVFRVAGVPFHQWAPDVYEGAPTTVTGFMATAVKVAAFGALLRVVAVAFSATQATIYVPLWWIAVLSMTVGNVMALVQRNIKRMLAYSSIAHAGYMLVGICVGTADGYSAVLFYLLVYMFMSLGAFGVIAILNRDGEDASEIDALSGLHATRPFFAGVMALSMLALAGIPGTGGFMGKYQIFSAAVEEWLRAWQPGVGGSEVLSMQYDAFSAAVGQWWPRGAPSPLWLAVIGVLNSAISLAYYLRIPVIMYMRSPRAQVSEQTQVGVFDWLVLATCAFAIVLLGILPQNFGVFWDLNPITGATAAAQTLAP